MDALKRLRITSLQIGFLLTFSIWVSVEAEAKTYYLATNGSNLNDGSASSPWGTFAHAIPRLQPGDILLVKDGTYYQSIRMTKSGTPGKPISIKAQNDGKAIIDGQYKREPFKIDPRPLRLSDFLVEGLVFQNSSAHVLQIINVDRITIRRVSGYNAGGENTHVFSFYKVTDSLIEDCVAARAGRVLFNIYISNGITLRRCYGRYLIQPVPEKNRGPNIIQIYGTSNSLVENCVGTKFPDTNLKTIAGLHVWANDGQTASHNKIIGNVMYDIAHTGNSSSDYAMAAADRQQTGNEFTDNVSINNARGVDWEGDNDLKFNRMTLVNNITAFAYRECCESTPYYVSKAALRNSLLLQAAYGIDMTGWHTTDGSRFAGFTHEYNNLYDIETPYVDAPYHNLEQEVGEISIDPGFNTAKYGKGAYLIRPDILKGKGENGSDIGAEILYRYVDGLLTEEPLWPWPMEDRIMAELAASVTFEAKGGLWKTLDGIYAGDSDSDIDAPSAPTGLNVQINKVK